MDIDKEESRAYRHYEAEKTSSVDTRAYWIIFIIAALVAVIYNPLSFTVLILFATVGLFLADAMTDLYKIQQLKPGIRLIGLIWAFIEPISLLIVDVILVIIFIYVMVLNIINHK